MSIPHSSSHSLCATMGSRCVSDSVSAAVRLIATPLPALPVVPQIQMRDIQGFVETRYRLLQLRPNNRNNWVTWAVAHHLDGNYDMAVQIIRGYESTVVGGAAAGGSSGRGRGQREGGIN